MLYQLSYARVFANAKLGEVPARMQGVFCECRKAAKGARSSCRKAPTRCCVRGARVSSLPRARRRSPRAPRKSRRERGERHHVVARPRLAGIRIEMQRRRGAECGGEFVGLRIEFGDFPGKSFARGKTREQPSQQPVPPAEIENAVLHLRVREKRSEPLGRIHPFQHPANFACRLPLQRGVARLEADIHSRKSVERMAEKPTLRKYPLHAHPFPRPQSVPDVMKLRDRIRGDSPRPRCSIGHGVKPHIHPSEQRGKAPQQPSRLLAGDERKAGALRCGTSEFIAARCCA